MFQRSRNASLLSWKTELWDTKPFMFITLCGPSKPEVESDLKEATIENTNLSVQLKLIEPLSIQGIGLSSAGRPRVPGWCLQIKVRVWHRGITKESPIFREIYFIP